MARLTETVQSLSDRYIRKARALHGFCECLADSTDDPELASSCRALKAFLFPRGLSLLKRSYTEQVGAVLELETCMTPEIMRQLQGIRVGSRTLADLYNSWVETGKEMGDCVTERAHLQASLSREGTAAPQANRSIVRFQWIRAAHMLVAVVNGLPLSDEAREMFFALLEKTTEAARRRHKSHADEGVADDSDARSDADAEPAENPAEPAETPAAKAPAEPAETPAETPAAQAEPVAEAAAEPAAEPATEPATPAAESVETRGPPAPPLEANRRPRGQSRRQMPPAVPPG